MIQNNLPIHQYPYSDFHELNLSYIMQLARESLGIHLEVVGNKLQLKNAANEVISNVTISYATVASKDETGHDIEAYIYDAALDGRAIVFTDGTGDTTVIPFPTDAVTDANGKNLTSYVAKVDVAGNKLRVTDGTGTAYTFTCPYANDAGKANTDENGKSLTTYMASVTVVDNKLVFRDGDNVILAEITVPYATTAETAEKAAKDINGNAFVSDYGRNLIVDGNKVGIEAHDGTDLNKITVPFATLSTDATNAIKTITISGNNILFTTHGGQVTSIECPYSVKALKDDLGNTIKSSYVANVVNNSVTGEITFLDALGHEIVSITPTVDSAVHDSLGNNLYDYVKTIVASPNSDYVQVTEGDGSSYTLTINYSNKAWKDTYSNIIGNTYCSLLTMGVDPQTQEPVVIGWNGETPKAEIFRLKVVAVSAQKDQLGNVIDTFYGHSLSYTSSGDRIDLLDAHGNSISYINIDDDEGVTDVQSSGTEVAPSDFLGLPKWTNTFTPHGGSNQIQVTKGGNVSLFNVSGNHSVIPVTDDVSIPTSQVDIKPLKGLIAYGGWGADETDTPPYWDPLKAALYFDIENTYAKYSDVPDELGDLSDVAVSSASNGNVLTYNSTTQEWVPAAPSGGADELDDLSDVDVSAATDGQVLTYDSATTKWIPTTPSGSTDPYLDYAFDVTQTTGGQLYWNFTQFIQDLDSAAQGSIPHNLSTFFANTTPVTSGTGTKKEARNFNIIWGANQPYLWGKVISEWDDVTYGSTVPAPYVYVTVAMGPLEVSNVLSTYYLTIKIFTNGNIELKKVAKL